MDKVFRASFNVFVSYLFGCNNTSRVPLLYPHITRYKFLRHERIEVYKELHYVTTCYIMLQMSSNITIPKICSFCKQNFIAKTTVTKFCSLQCASRAYKYNSKKQKIETAQEEEYQKSVGIDMSAIQTKEFLSIKEACLLLGISRTSLHRYIKNKLIKITKIGSRVIIKRELINNLIK